MYYLRVSGHKKPDIKSLKICIYTFVVVGRCVPAIFADIADSISDVLVTKDNETVVDKLGNEVNGTFLEDATK